MAKSLKGDDKILNRIKGLLDKAGSTDSLAEKEACMIKVQELMQNHQLDSTRVTSYEQVAEEGVEEDEILYDEIYEEDLLHYISLCNFCVVILKGKKVIPNFGDGFEDLKSESMIKPGDYKDRMAIIGEPSNVNMCLYLYSFYRNAILNLAITKYTNFLVEMEVDTLKLKLPRDHKKKFIENYVAGCVKGVYLKMKEQKETAEKSSNALQGIMVIKKDKVQKYLEEHYPRLGRSGRGSGGNSNSSAYGAGVNDGRGLSHNAGVNQGNRGYIG